MEGQSLPIRLSESGISLKKSKGVQPNSVHVVTETYSDPWIWEWCNYTTKGILRPKQQSLSLKKISWHPSHHAIHAIKDS